MDAVKHHTSEAITYLRAHLPEPRLTTDMKIAAVATVVGLYLLRHSKFLVPLALFGASYMAVRTFRPANLDICKQNG